MRTSRDDSATCPVVTKASAAVFASTPLPSAPRRSGSATGALLALRAFFMALVLALGGCASLPSEVHRDVSYARTDVADTRLAAIASTSIGSAAAADAPARSGFQLLAEGADALDARLALINAAEKSLDVQYYLIANDRTGLAFVRALCQAAARGVRVRVLVDDLYATGEDRLFAALAARPGVEVRMFNPLPVRDGGLMKRVALSLHDFSRINHRMHNKLFIADGAFAVVGGRNIADEYFERSAATNFIDMDVVAAGPVVAELASVFDRFWNSQRAYPVLALVGAATEGAETADLAAGAADPAAAPVAAAGTRGFAGELARGRIDLHLGGADVLADAPEKTGADAQGVSEGHRRLIASAHASVVIASPYFIPGRQVFETVRDRIDNGVQVSILTNSRATTDEPLVHLGYARYRLALLTAGVGLHELVPTAAAAALHTSSGSAAAEGSSGGRLHTKLAVIDEEKLFVGSMNMDRRSETANTEIGLVVRSPRLAAEVAQFLRDQREDRSYELKLGSQGADLVWISGSGSERRQEADEPGGKSAGLGMRLVVTLAEDLL